jgi:hypothetical protein
MVGKVVSGGFATSFSKPQNFTCPKEKALKYNVSKG